VDSLTLHGRGLHTGEPCALTLTRAPGPFRFDTARGDVTREALRVLRTDRGVRVRADDFGFELELVEHLFAAFAGLGVQSGVSARVLGPEVPLADGGALLFAQALSTLAAPSAPSSLRVARPGELSVGRSVYAFTPSEGVSVSVTVEFPGRGVETATWDGSRAQFLAHIAPARTFGFRHEYAALQAEGRAAHVDPSSVLVLEPDGSTLASEPPLVPDELARHKLLDLLGDSYLFGGPVIGHVRAFRPGHTSTHHVVREALAQGILQRTRAC
jgi:UDP-3-O-[3-hydroxymyristoyl] N-acetylglucosamine deacetylase